MKKIKYITDSIPFIHVDEWKPTSEQDVVFKHLKDEFVAPVSAFLGVPNNIKLDCFSLKPKKAYKSEEARKHYCQYLNYFEKFYDQDRELVAIYANIKILIDGNKGIYTEELLKQDIEKYILSDSIRWKVERMNNDNYIPLRKKYVYKKNPGLEYNDEHCMEMMKISLLQIMMIPILTHFIHVNNIININPFLLDMYTMLLSMKGTRINLENKFYETVKSITDHNANINPIWGQQDIRGINTTTFTIETTNIIIINLMHKYLYSSGPVAMNLSSVKKNLRFQVVENEYEFVFVKLDTTKKDEDSNSEFDMFESYTSKQDESLYIELNHISKQTMKTIEAKYGPFDQNEIEFYRKRLFDDPNEPINAFQKNLVFNLFYEDFGDTESIKGINNKDDYIKLVIAAKRKLIAHNMAVLPYVISSKVIKSISRQKINQKEKAKFKSGELYQEIQEKYAYNEKVENHILSLIATITSSEFLMIDYNDSRIDNQILPAKRVIEFIQEEIRKYVMLV